MTAAYELIHAATMNRENSNKSFNIQLHTRYMWLRECSELGCRKRASSAPLTTNGAYT